jgi:hypothetical protein
MLVGGPRFGAARGLGTGPLDLLAKEQIIEIHDILPPRCEREVGAAPADFPPSNGGRSGFRGQQP